jgi:hypothetical protein
MKPRFTTFRVSVGFQHYNVLCRVLPPTKAAHVGADSPRFLAPGTGGAVQLIRVLKDAVDVTDRIDTDLRRTLIERACLMAGVKRESAAPRPSGQLPLPMEGGHLERAMERMK